MAGRPSTGGRTKDTEKSENSDRHALKEITFRDRVTGKIVTALLTDSELISESLGGYGKKTPPIAYENFFYACECSVCETGTAQFTVKSGRQATMYEVDAVCGDCQREAYLAKIEERRKARLGLHPRSAAE